MIWAKNVHFLTLGCHVVAHNWLIIFKIWNRLPCDNKKLLQKIIMYILKIKSQPLDASSIINIQFNITKFNNHDCMSFLYYDHPQHGIYDLCFWS